MKILLPIDGSERALATIRQVATFIDKKTAEIYILMIVVPVSAELPWGLYSSNEEELVHSRLKEAKNLAESLGLNIVHTEYLIQSEPALAICDYASERQIDLIIIG